MNALIFLKIYMTASQELKYSHHKFPACPKICFHKAACCCLNLLNIIKGIFNLETACFAEYLVLANLTPDTVTLSAYVSQILKSLNHPL